MTTSRIPIPETIKETGLSRNLLSSLMLKTLYLEGELSLLELAEHMRLSFPVVEQLFEHLRKEELCQVKGMTGHVHQIVTTSRGKEEALDALSRSQYAGPAPVSLKEYVTRVREQTVRDLDVHPEDVREAFKELVLSPETLTQLGTAVVSGKSIFLYGPTGTGKTALAETIPNIYQDHVWLPYAVEVDNQFIAVFDSDIHERIGDVAESDGRWVHCQRPRVLTGGELTPEMLDLQFNPVTKFYAAPLQMKANNGVLIIDDFGRQRMRPEELLNRWIVPLDRRLDFLTLMGGKKFEIPFDSFVVFSTNQDPSTLLEDAFLRRIQSKVRVGYMNQTQFQEIFQRLCSKSGLEYDEAVIDHLIRTLADMNQPLRACYPRDFIEQIRWRAHYERKQPQLDRETLAQACRNYFVSPEFVSEIEDASAA